MSAEDLCAHPEETVQKFCVHMGIEYKPESLHWESLGEDFEGQAEWGEAKQKEMTHHWHGDAIKSTGFGKPSLYEVDSLGEPTFSEIADLEHRAVCKNGYLEQLVYYELIMKNQEQ